MPTLSDQDRQLVAALRNYQVFQNIEGHRLDLTRGVITVLCGDGDQKYDIFTHYAQLCLEQRADVRMHELALNGGALLLAPDTPLVRENSEDAVLMKHLRQACDLKKIATVALCAHAPCGVAAFHEIGLIEVIYLLMRGKARIKREIPNMKVACFIHVDKGPENKRTYFVSRERWEKWVELAQPSVEYRMAGVVAN